MQVIKMQGEVRAEAILVMATDLAVDQMFPNNNNGNK